MAQTARLPNVGDKVYAFSPKHRKEIKVQVKKVFTNSFQGIDNERNIISSLSKWRPANSTPAPEILNADAINGTAEPSPEKVLPTTEALSSLPLEQIIVEHRFQQRSDLYNGFSDDGEPFLDPSIVERYQELLLKDDDGNPKDPPPLLVHHFDGKFYLVDGFHRYAALQSEGRTVAPCEIVESSEPDALLQSCTVNLKNGLGVRKSDISRSIWRIFSVIDSLPDSDPRRKWSDRHIARMLGCSNSTVSIVHNQFQNKKAFEEMKLVPGVRIKCIDPNSKYNGFIGQITRLDLSQGCIVTFDRGQTEDLFIYLPPQSLVKTQEVFTAPPSSDSQPTGTNQETSGNSDQSSVSNQQSTGDQLPPTSQQSTGDRHQSTATSHQSSGNAEQSPATSVEPLLEEKQFKFATDEQISDLFAKSSFELLRRLNDESRIPPKLDDLVETVWEEMKDFDQRQKEHFLVMLIDKLLF